jgi:hypothetical protein
MPDGYIGKSTEEERTVALVGSGNDLDAYVSIAMFGNYATTAKLRLRAVFDDVVVMTERNYYLVPVAWLYHNRKLLTWTLRLGLRSGCPAPEYHSFKGYLWFKVASMPIKTRSDLSRRLKSNILRTISILPAAFWTQNGVTLFQRVTASIHLVEKTLGGRIPTLAETEKATEPMTQAGAVQTAPGAMRRIIFPQTGRLQLQKHVYRVQSKPYQEKNLTN